MTQDVNKIINTISQLHAATSIEDKKQIAVLMEENERLKQQLEALTNNVEDESDLH